MKTVEPRVRGIVAARADANVSASIAELNKTFAAFREANDARLTELEKGREDVVTNEKVDRINADISLLTKAVEDAKATVDALRIGGGGGDAPSAEKKAHRDAFNKWFRRGAEPESGMRALEVKAELTTLSDPDGGYLVPETMETTIDRVLGTVSAIRSISRVIQTGGGGYKKLINQGGAASGWVSERAARTETATPTLAEIIINAGELYAEPAATQRVLDDSMINIEGWLADEVSIEFAEQEGASFVSGDGIEKPRGFLSYDKVANASYAWGKTGFVISGAAANFATPSTTVSPADAIIDLYYALKSGYRMGAQFVTSDAVLGTIRKFKDGDGTMLWAPPTADMPATILGKPVVTDDNMPAVGAGTFPLAFGNFLRGYLITDVAGIRVLRDPYTSKGNVIFYTTKRVGGGIVNFEAIKLLKIAAS
jgi:HK97 family phage major capsid protein